MRTDGNPPFRVDYEEIVRRYPALPLLEEQHVEYIRTIAAIWLLYFLISRSAATRVVSLFYLTPPVTALLAWALFNERLAVGALIGMIFCVVGVFLVNWQIAAK